MGYTTVFATAALDPVPLFGARLSALHRDENRLCVEEAPPQEIMKVLKEMYSL